jgi:hypothetical protein
MDDPCCCAEIVLQAVQGYDCQVEQAVMQMVTMHGASSMRVLVNVI